MVEAANIKFILHGVWSQWLCTIGNNAKFDQRSENRVILPTCKSCIHIQILERVYDVNRMAGYGPE